jgi:hypothetical protein
MQVDYIMLMFKSNSHNSQILVFFGCVTISDVSMAVFEDHVIANFGVFRLLHVLVLIYDNKFSCMIVFLLMYFLQIHV